MFDYAMNLQINTLIIKYLSNIFVRHSHSVGNKKRPRIPTHEGRKGYAIFYKNTYPSPVLGVGSGVIPYL